MSIVTTAGPVRCTANATNDCRLRTAALGLAAVAGLAHRLDAAALLHKLEAYLQGEWQLLQARPSCLEAVAILGVVWAAGAHPHTKH